MIGAAREPTVLRATLALLAAGMRDGAGARPAAAQRLAALRMAIAEDPQRRWTPAEAAGVLGCNRLVANRTVRALAGTSLRRWLVDRRLDAAADDLEEGVGVGAAARRHGWSDPFLFSRLFRARFGVPPIRWRRSAP